VVAAEQVTRTPGNKFDVTAVRADSTSALIPHESGKGRLGVATVCIKQFKTEATSGRVTGNECTCIDCSKLRYTHPRKKNRKTVSRDGRARTANADDRDDCESSGGRHLAVSKSMLDEQH
jgi:hypothetical protein